MIQISWLQITLALIITFVTGSCAVYTTFATKTELKDSDSRILQYYKTIDTRLERIENILINGGIRNEKLPSTC
jgi:hypothetical protein